MADMERRVEVTEKKVETTSDKLDKLNHQLIRLQFTVESSIEKMSKYESEVIKCRAETNSRINKNSEDINNLFSVVRSIQQSVERMTKVYAIVSTAIALSIVGALMSLVLK